MFHVQKSALFSNLKTNPFETFQALKYKPKMDSTVPHDVHDHHEVEWAHLSICSGHRLAFPAGSYIYQDTMY